MKYMVFVLALLVSSDASAGSSQPYGRLHRAVSAGDRPVQRLGRIDAHRRPLPVAFTMFLGLRNVCVERSARLLFHSGHNRRMEINAASTARMMSA